MSLSELNVIAEHCLRAHLMRVHLMGVFNVFISMYNILPCRFLYTPSIFDHFYGRNQFARFIYSCVQTAHRNIFKL